MGKAALDSARTVAHQRRDSAACAATAILGYGGSDELVICLEPPDSYIALPTDPNYNYKVILRSKRRT